MLKSIIDENNLQDSYINLGKTDAKLGRDIKEVNEYIDSESRSFIKRYLSDLRSRLMVVNNSIDHISSNITKNNESLLQLNTEIMQNPSSGIFNIILMYMIPAILYIIGDILFSKELIVQGWGLGNSGSFEIWGLALAIGVAPFLVKFVFEKFINPHMNSNSIFLRRFLTGFYVFLGLIMVTAFLQIGYLRGILFQMTKVTIEGNIYDTLYATHPMLMVWSFVVVALMFIIGGGVLLSIGPKQLSAWFSKQKNQRVIRKINNANQALFDELNELVGEQEYISNLNCNDDKLDGEIQDLSNTLYYHYKTGYYSHIEEQKSINKDSIDKLGLSEYLRVSLDKMAKNEKLSNRGLS